MADLGGDFHVLDGVVQPAHLPHRPVTLHQQRVNLGIAGGFGLLLLFGLGPGLGLGLLGGRRGILHLIPPVGEQHFAHMIGDEGGQRRHNIMCGPVQRGQQRPEKPRPTDEIDGQRAAFFDIGHGGRSFPVNGIVSFSILPPPTLPVKKKGGGPVDFNIFFM